MTQKFLICAHCQAQHFKKHADLKRCVACGGPLVIVLKRQAAQQGTTLTLGPPEKPELRLIKGRIGPDLP